VVRSPSVKTIPLRTSAYLMKERIRDGLVERLAGVCATSLRAIPRSTASDIFSLRLLEYAFMPGGFHGDQTSSNSPLWAARRAQPNFPLFSMCTALS
jgi:hypothetical protein